MTIMQLISVISMIPVPFTNVRTVIYVRYVEDFRFDYGPRLVNGSQHAYFVHRAVHVWDFLLTHDVRSAHYVQYIWVVEKVQDVHSKCSNWYVPPLWMFTTIGMYMTVSTVDNWNCWLKTDIAVW